MTSRIASFREFQTKLGMLPAKKNLITTQGSVSPAAFFVVKMLVSVFRHGTSMKPKNR